MPEMPVFTPSGSNRMARKYAKDKPWHVKSGQKPGLLIHPLRVKPQIRKRASPFGKSRGDLGDLGGCLPQHKDETKIGGTL